MTEFADFKAAIEAIGTMDKNQLESVFHAYRQRAKALSASEALVNQAALTTGTRVVTKGLRPKYLNGIHGTVDGTANTRIVVMVDETERWKLNGRYGARLMSAPTEENAFGRPVPTERQVAALDTAVEDIGIDPLLADPVIREAARYVELDKPEKALIVLRNITDLTGAYRLLAVLCT